MRELDGFMICGRCTCDDQTVIFIGQLLREGPSLSAQFLPPYNTTRILCPFTYAYQSCEQLTKQQDSVLVSTFCGDGIENCLRPLC
jgi:hypothetical protein